FERRLRIGEEGVQDVVSRPREEVLDDHLVRLGVAGQRLDHPDHREPRLAVNRAPEDIARHRPGLLRQRERIDAGPEIGLPEPVGVLGWRSVWPEEAWAMT